MESLNGVRSSGKEALVVSAVHEVVFALTLGLGIPLYKKLGVGYRFMHSSDAGVNGLDTIGADFHMVEFIYRL